LTSATPVISVVIPFRNSLVTLEKALRSLEQQAFREFELILIDDDSSDAGYLVASKFSSHVLRNARRLGPAASRNVGIREARGEIIFFMDSDCVADRDLLACVQREFEADSKTGAIAGSTRIPASNLLGDCISELGFPGGANAGFDKIWPVSRNGRTSHISSCNCAIRRKILERVGGFDESFLYAGAEDSELSHRLVKTEVGIKYCPSLIVWHEPRKDLVSYMKWQIVRGRANYHFKRRVGKVGKFIRLRSWSSRNIIRNNISKPRIFIVIGLLALSLLMQQVGYLLEKFAVGTSSHS